MKPFTLIAISIILAAFIYSCREKDTSKADMYSINLTEGYSDTTLHLEDFAEDVRLIRLETSKQCLISYLRGHIGEKHIIVMGRENMLHFSADDGSFIGTITQKGKGPYEFNYIEAWEVNENGQKLIYHDQRKSYINCYNLKDQKFEDPIKLAIDEGADHLGNIILAKDTLLAIKRGMFSGCKYLYFYQSTTGRFIEGRKKEPVPHPGAWAGIGATFKEAGNSIFYQPSESDTLFSIEGAKMKSVASFYLAQSRKDGEFTMKHHGSFLYKYKNRIFLRKINYKTRITKKSARIKSLDFEYFIFNTNNQQLYRIDSLYYDRLGLELRDHKLRFRHENLFAIHYQAMEFKDMIREQLKNGDIPVAKRERLKQLNGKISDNDNPIIITARCK
ncbi:MAG: 6-bladed beta-propeller [Bacteroidales bacterium]|nr:6-bladed beta-propeller [Bacteroidales bacterium]